MKTVAVTAEQTALGKLIEEVYEGAPVLLTFGEKVVKIERYVPGQVPLDLEEDSPELEAELLAAIKGPFSPYSRQDLEDIIARVRREKSGG